MTATGIIKAVCDCYNITDDELLSKIKERHLVDARKTASYLIRFRLGYTLGKVGIAMKRDHSTIAHYMTSHRELMKNDSNYIKLFNDISKAI